MSHHELITMRKSRWMVLLVLGACGDAATTQSTPAPDATWVGTTECASCHVDEAQAWIGSHHDLAMQDATEETVLGDFGEAAFTNFGDFTIFSRRGDAFVIQTEGPDGDVADFEVAYVFGVDPLQQYLIELDGGRLQAFTVAWDTRPAEEGGQRWFHLYPDEQISAGDRLHWTGPSMNWNYMCAECHTTALQRNFELATLTYETTWSEMDVSCESCHGPGSQHLALVESGVTRSSPIGLGLNPGLTDRTGGGWVIEDGEAIAHRTVSLAGSGQVETCAHCHSRRATLEQVRDPATSIHNSDMVSRLEPGLYHADGQILEEVYVYGSFVQSKMYNAGVRCSDCHEPHSLELNAPGNAIASKSSTRRTTTSMKRAHRGHSALSATCLRPPICWSTHDGITRCGCPVRRSRRKSTPPTPAPCATPISPAAGQRTSWRTGTDPVTRRPSSRPGQFMRAAKDDLDLESHWSKSPPT